MARYGMVIDVNKCSGCYNCFLACKDEHCGHDYPGYTSSQPTVGHSWMQLLEKERGNYPKIKLAYIPLSCMHCQDATCIKAAKNEAVYRRPDGIVIIDPIKAKGQKQLVSSCPYRTIYWNEALNLPQKCTFCAHLLDDRWKEPRCVELCPTRALVFGDLDNPKSEVGKLVASGKTEALHPEYGLKENIVYIGIPKKFVSGTVAYDDSDRYAEGVTVTLSGNGKKKITKTNNFGDFEFEGLPDNLEFTIKIEDPKYKAQDFHIKTQTDIYIGIVILKK